MQFKLFKPLVRKLIFFAMLASFCQLTVQAAQIQPITDINSEFGNFDEFDDLDNDAQAPKPKKKSKLARTAIGAAVVGGLAAMAAAVGLVVRKNKSTTNTTNRTNFNADLMDPYKKTESPVDSFYTPPQQPPVFQQPPFIPFTTQTTQMYSSANAFLHKTITFKYFEDEPPFCCGCFSSDGKYFITTHKYWLNSNHRVFNFHSLSTDQHAKTEYSNDDIPEIIHHMHDCGNGRLLCMGCDRNQKQHELLLFKYELDPSQSRFNLTSIFNEKIDSFDLWVNTVRFTSVNNSCLVEVRPASTSNNFSNEYYAVSLTKQTIKAYPRKCEFVRVVNNGKILFCSYNSDMKTLDIKLDTKNKLSTPSNLDGDYFMQNIEISPRGDLAFVSWVQLYGYNSIIEKSCILALYQLDFENREIKELHKKLITHEEMVFGSAHARFSPDGRFILALTNSGQYAYIFDRNLNVIFDFGAFHEWLPDFGFDCTGNKIYTYNKNASKFNIFIYNSEHQQLEAFATGMHPRCGAGSNVPLLSNDLNEHICQIVAPHRRWHAPRLYLKID